MIRMGRPRKKPAIKYTRLELKLLEFPPTEETWLCDGKWLSYDYVANRQVEARCDTINPGRNQECWICKKEKSDKVLWPIYQEAVKKKESESQQVVAPLEKREVKRTRRVVKRKG